MSIFSPSVAHEKVVFTKSLAVMLRSGIAINDALSALASQSGSPHFATVVRRVLRDVENGTLLSSAFGKEIKTFGAIFVSLVRAGEESGTLQDNLQFLADWLTRNADLRREVAAATLYPKLVFGASIILGGSLTVFILPKLVPLFGKLDATLPFITKVLLAISLFVQEYWMLTTIGVAAVFGALLYVNRFRAVRRFFHTIYIRMPFLGSLMRDYQLALVTQLFSTLIRSGLSINESVSIVAEAATNIRYAEAVEDIRGSITKGTTLSESMKKYDTLFPPLAINIVAVGEHSGTLVDSFGYLAEYYTKEVNAKAKRLPTIIEPILLVFIAGVVGFIALAMIMPIYELTSSLSR